MIKIEKRGSNFADLEIHGQFEINDSFLVELGHEAFKHIICAVTYVENFQTFAPFEKKIFFSDDISIDDGVMKGNFDFNLFSFMRYKIPVKHFIHVSLGSEISNLVTIDTLS